VPPTGRLIEPLMLLPLPRVGVTEPPPETAVVKLTPESEAGTLSVNAAPVTTVGPALATVMV
jgi:hypothetical protein